MFFTWYCNNTSRLQRGYPSSSPQEWTYCTAPLWLYTDAAAQVGWGGGGGGGGGKNWREAILLWDHVS